MKVKYISLKIEKKAIRYAIPKYHKFFHYDTKAELKERSQEIIEYFDNPDVTEFENFYITITVKKIEYED